jgi:drug/metabolite transporter (DMT)-like permease
MSEAGPNLSISQSHARSTRIALSALFCGAVGIGFAPICVRLSELGPSATAFWRLALSLPPLWLWLAIERQATGTPRRPSCVTDYRRLAVAGLAVWHWSITLTSVANATLLANATPIFVTLAAWLWFGQRFTPTFILGMAAAMAGATILAGASLRLSLQHLLGDALGLLTAIFYAGYILAVKELRDDFSTATIMTRSGVVSAVALLPITLLSGEGLIAFTTRGWTVLVGLALVSHIGGQGLITYALAHLPAAFSSVGLLLQPAVAAMLAWIILDEPIGPWQALGGAIVLGGVVVARQGSRSA